jgi:hypothetical protein
MDGHKEGSVALSRSQNASRHRFISKVVCQMFCRDYPRAKPDEILTQGLVVYKLR